MKKYDVVGIGNAILDFIYEDIDDSLLEEFGLVKGEMRLIDNQQSQKFFNRLYEYSPNIFPGGSSANTLAGVCAMGGKTVFFGKIGNDKYGNIYEEKTKGDGVITCLSRDEDDITGHAITLITRDCERSFAVNLGAAVNLNEDEISEDEIKQSKILHIEGYQVEDTQLREVIFKAVSIAKQNGVLVSLDLCDPALVRRNLITFKDLVKDSVDILFANESEAKAFTKKSPEDAIVAMGNMCKIAVVKLGEKGSLIRKDNKTYTIAPRKTKVVSTNGAGDMYASGILFGIANDIDIERAGKIASYSASLVVEIPEARIGRSLVEDIKKIV